jgi:hypothetical protein
MPSIVHAGVIALFAVAPAGLMGAPPSLGVFTGQGDVGTVLHTGSAYYDPAQDTYTVSGSGENIWFGTDDFHFVWQKVSGDLGVCRA